MADSEQPADSAKPDETLPRRLREAWLRTVGTWATDDKGTASLLSRLVDFGTLSTEEAKRVLLDARKRIDENKRELDRRVDDSVQKAVTFFSSEQKELKRLEDRMAELEARLKTLKTP